MKKILLALTFFLSCLISIGQSDKRLNKLFLEIKKIENENSISNPIWNGKHPTTYSFHTKDKKWPYII